MSFGQMRFDSPSHVSVDPQKRLPVNPRRTKVAPDQRKRVVRACNNCNVKRVKCTGKQPCERCEKSSRECVYPPAEIDKNALKDELNQLRAQAVEIDQLKERCAFYQQRLRDMGADESTTTLAFNADNAWPLARALKSSSFAPSHHAEPDKDGRMLSDELNRARYHGGTSGATFLDCLKKFMTEVAAMEIARSVNGSSFLESVGKYQTYDSRKLPTPLADETYLPARTEMQQLLIEFRYMLGDGNEDFSSGGIYWWGDVTQAPSIHQSTFNKVLEDPLRHLAFFHVCFALTIVVGNIAMRNSQQEDGNEHYFHRARKLLGDPLDTKYGLRDVPVLTLMGFYLIEVNRRDAAYMYISLAVNVALTHGAFRKNSSEASTRKSWTLFILDRWLSVLMGRPPSIPDEAVCLDMPAQSPGMPSAAGLYAHVVLAKISSYIVCETFKIAPRQSYADNSTSSMEQALDMLNSWQRQLPAELQMPDDLNHEDPACCMLHMEHNQLVLLTTRPMLFASVKQALSQRESQQFVEPHAQDEHNQICTGAARSNIHLARVVKAMGRKLMQAGLHFVFNAAVVLLLNQFMTVAQQAANPFADRSAAFSSLPDIDESDIRFALETFEEEGKISTNGYQKDCSRVLQDLKWLIDVYSNSSRTANPGAAREGSGSPMTALGTIEYPPDWAQTKGLAIDETLCM